MIASYDGQSDGLYDMDHYGPYYGLHSHCSVSVNTTSFDTKPDY